ncbi:DUF2970 domain-containing protein [Rheinheimera sp. F8]|uniref:DUF2970 domain-containing protein n=1 Tax=Rheinheimera sp. F8 TaxID=1763998 RepID=UPI000744B594|nr:DUF2970 domain-containing protein [Rheinheimera sp. F8]ALZ75574.1 hypothetical protein ATY27_07255 [Rheinheimera sp. F8]ALZ77395.1 hypothetical protein ATY27_17605 [Rheinheimera sp. F8]
MTGTKPGLRQILKAVFGAFIGVQSEQQRQQDFQTQGPLPYIIAGVIVTLCFVLGLILVVSLVLS